MTAVFSLLYWVFGLPFFALAMAALFFGVSMLPKSLIILIGMVFGAGLWARAWIKK